MSTGTTQHGYPSLAASRFVQRYIERRQSCGGVAIVTPPAVARSCALWNFELGDPLRIRQCATGLIDERTELTALVGLETRAKHQFLLSGAFHGFQIHFRPTALHEFFGVPMPEMTDRYFDADAVLRSKVSDLRERLGEAGSFEQRIQIADAFIAGLRAKKAPHRSIELASGEIIQSRGGCIIDRLAHDAGFSMRNFQRTFQQCVGVTPKLYAHVVRFESVLRAKAAAPGAPWVKVANDAGYHDQMHMIHDFKEFTGGSPTAMFGEADKLLSPHADFKDETLPHSY